MFATAFIIAAVALPQVLAHGGVLSYDIAGTHYPGFSPYNSASGQTTIQRPWASYNPIQGATSATLACNDDGTSLASGQLTVTVSAGTAIKANWNQVWPHPYGPQLTYLAKCPGTTCTGVSASSLDWFKIDQSGLLSGTVYAGQWAAGQMINQTSTWTSTIPASVPSGNYLIRFETIALHSMPAQFYPECAQLNIINGGSLAPTSSELVKFPGGYSDNDPGLNINLYSNAAQTQTTYVIPGPPLYAGAASGGSSPAPSSSKSSSSTITAKPTTSTVVSTTKPTSTSSSSGTGNPRYAQCGGSGFTGSTVCASPYTCTSSSQYYAQCL